MCVFDLLSAAGIASHLFGSPSLLLAMQAVMLFPNSLIGCSTRMRTGTQLADTGSASSSLRVARPLQWQDPW
jgi:hypothetical protein